MFKFKRFDIDHSNCAMKVGTDAIMLGAWTNTIGVTNVLDVGGGSGIVSLIVAQRNEHAQITALEIEPGCAAQAVSNFVRSPWADRLNCVEVDARKWECADELDLIISNPPFFADSFKAKDMARSLARHTDTLTIDDLFSIWSKKGSDDSTLALVLPYGYLTEVETICAKQGYYMWRQLLVSPKANAAPNRVLLQLTKIYRSMEIEELVIHGDGGYTNAYKQLTSELYLGH